MDAQRTAAMTSHHARRIVIICLLLATTGASSFAAMQARQSYDPASQRPAEKPPDSFVDFALKRINPSDKNYGQCIDEGRKFVLEETIENGYFWSNVVALGLLGCLFVIIVYQRNRQARREWVVAEALQQYEHALARANAQVDEVTKRNRELMEALTGDRESALRSPIALLERGEQEGNKSSPKRSSAAQPAEVTTIKSSQVSAKTETAKAGGNGVKPTTQIPLFKPEVDLVVKVNSLEQQLGRSQEQEKHLRRQLNQSELRLQTEQQKNRALKGE
jgi:hypothetical protein